MNNLGRIVLLSLSFFGMRFVHKQKQNKSTGRHSFWSSSKNEPPNLIAAQTNGIALSLSYVCISLCAVFLWLSSARYYIYSHRIKSICSFLSLFCTCHDCVRAMTILQDFLQAFCQSTWKKHTHTHNTSTSTTPTGSNNFLFYLN